MALLSNKASFADRRGVHQSHYNHPIDQAVSSHVQDSSRADVSQTTVPNVEGGQRAGSLAKQSQVVGCGRVLIIMREDSDISNMYSFGYNGLDIHDVKVGRHMTLAGCSARFVV